MQALRHSRLTFLGVGLAIGLVIGLNLQGIWPSIPLHATATHGQDNFAIATGLAEDGVEALYFLDYLTGDLKAAVIQPFFGRFMAYYQYNIVNDFGGAKLKNPNYLMVTGHVNVPRAARPVQLGGSLIYVAEATTGIVAVYAIPYNTSLSAARKEQKGTFILMDKQPFRTIIERDKP